MPKDFFTFQARFSVTKVSCNKKPSISINKTQEKVENLFVYCRRSQKSFQNFGGDKKASLQNLVSFFYRSKDFKRKSWQSKLSFNLSSISFRFKAFQTNFLSFQGFSLRRNFPFEAFCLQNFFQFTTNLFKTLSLNKKILSFSLKS